MYFNNSCEVKTTNENYNIYYAEYGNLTFCSAVTHENIILTQFHPELSANDGLKVFKYLKIKFDNVKNKRNIRLRTSQR